MRWRKEICRVAEISFRTVSKIYEEEEGLFDFSVDIAKSESFGLLGPTGSGKSTALSLLMGFIRPDEGRSPSAVLTAFQSGM